MKARQEEPVDRPNASRVLSEIGKPGRRAFDLLPPGRRREAAFALSMDACKMRIAGMRVQGFSDSEIRAVPSARRP